MFEGKHVFVGHLDDFFVSCLGLSEPTWSLSTRMGRKFGHYDSSGTKSYDLATEYKFGVTMNMET